MARYSEDFFLNLEHFCCFLFAEFIDLKSHHKFFGCENFQFPFCSWLVSRSGRQLSNDWSLMLVVYRYYILIYHSFLDNFRLGKGIANRPLAWGGICQPTERPTGSALSDHGRWTPLGSLMRSTRTLRFALLRRWSCPNRWWVCWRHPKVSFFECWNLSKTGLS